MVQISITGESTCLENIAQPKSKDINQHKCIAFKKKLAKILTKETNFYQMNIFSQRKLPFYYSNAGYYLYVELINKHYYL